MEGRNKKVFQAGANIHSEGDPTATANLKVPPSGEAKHPRPVAIRNPYATGRSSIGTYKTNSSSSSNTTVSTSCRSNSAAKLASEKAPPPKAAAPTALSGMNGQQQQHQQQQKSNELAYWERLPSRNISFAPAEVLTITECLREHQAIARLYCQEGRSVRITGMIDRRSVCSNDMVEMLVKDPMSTTTAAIAETIRAKLLGPNSKQRSFKARLSMSKEDQKRIRSKKRPWFASNNNSNNSSKTPGSKPIQTENTPPQTTLRVVVDPTGVAGASLHKAVVGSFVTVIGEFVVANSSDTNNNEALGELKAVRYDLEARTLMVINNHHLESSATTNMIFYEKALTLRRKSMYERYYCNDHNPLPNKLLQGCGPPPYDVFHRELDD